MRVGIIGAGASGMMAAITASRNGHKVTVLEHGVKPLKKILATGNGKCNYTNSDMNLNHYNDSCRNFVSHIYDRFGHENTVRFFNELGIEAYEKNGYFYPRSEQAAAIADSLLYDAYRLSIEFITECSVETINKRNGSFLVKTNKGGFEFEKLIVACGSFASPKTGSDGSGYDFAKKFGHNIVKPLPALCGLKCEGKFFKRISGVRCKAMVSLFVDDEFVKADVGELQLTDYGISGIPVFQISAEAVRAFDSGKNVSVDIDFYPESSDSFELMDSLKAKIAICPDKPCKDFLRGTFNTKLCDLFLDINGIDGDIKCGDLTSEDIESLAETINVFNVKVIGYNADNAQVCSGGVSLDDVKDTLESKKCEGLYFAGEILDVNGECGGYNLQWAWSSGYICGLLE